MFCHPYLVRPPQDLLHIPHSIVNASAVIEMCRGACNVSLLAGMLAYSDIRVGCVCAYTRTWL